MPGHEPPGSYIPGESDRKVKHHSGPSSLRQAAHNFQLEERLRGPAKLYRDALNDIPGDSALSAVVEPGCAGIGVAGEVLLLGRRANVELVEIIADHRRGDAV